MSAFSVEDDLDEVWKQAVAKCNAITSWDLNRSANFTIDQVVEKLLLVAPNRETTLKNVFHKALTCIQRFGAVAANAAASLVFGPSYQCFNAVNFVIEAIQGYDAIFNSIAALMERISTFFERLRLYLEDATAETKLDKRLRLTVYNVLEHFLFIMAKTHKLTRGWRGKVKVALKVGAFGDDSGIKDAMTKLETLIADVTSTEITVIVKDLSIAARDIRRVDQKLEDISALQQLDSLRLRSLISSEQQRIDRDRVNQLDRADEASFDSAGNEKRRQCVPNTRVDYLSRITSWATTPASKSMLWLRGVAGTGKSTIAKTVAAHLESKDLCHILSFFFVRGAGNASKTNKLLSTIAYQLSLCSELLRHYISNAIEQDQRLCHSSAASEQLEKLILQPLRQWRQDADDKLTIVLILDALDECDDSEAMLSIIRLLSATPDLEDMDLRIFITSRPEPDIKQVLEAMDCIGYQELSLLDEHGQTHDDDIRTFLVYELGQIQRSRAIPGVWPSEAQLQILVQKSAGLFIFAATACAFIKGSKLKKPTAQLEKICRLSNEAPTSFKDLDRMYLTVLESVLSEFDDEESVMLLRQVLGALAVLSSNLSASALEALTDMEADEILGSLQAVVYIDNNGFVRLIHQSFRDFLLDRTRCNDPRFSVDERLANYELTSQCLRVMSDRLCENICGLSAAGTIMSEMDQTTIDDSIPLVLRYACFHWVDHAILADFEVDDEGEIHAFLKSYSLAYFEAMGFIGGAFESQILFERLSTYTKNKQCLDLYKFLLDLMRFLSSFSLIISTAPLQVHYCAAYFSPELSHVWDFPLLCRSIPRWSVSAQGPDQSNRCRLTLEGHSGTITKIIFSNDDSKIISGSGIGEVRVWDFKTGQCLKNFEGQKGRIVDLDFLDDDKKLVCLAEHDVWLWDIQKGECLAQYDTFGTASRSAVRLAGLRAVFISILDTDTGRCSVSMQDLENREIFGEIEFDEYVDELTTNADRSLLMIVAQNRIQILDLRTFEQIRILEWQHQDGLVGGSISPNGTIMALSSQFNNMFLWNLNIDELPGSVQSGHQRFPRQTFSPDGSLLAAAKDGRIRVWEVETETYRHCAEIHSNGIYSIAFSSDGSALAIGSDDQMVRIWGMETNEYEPTGQGDPLGRICCSTISPDRKIVAFGCADHTVRLWDLEACSWRNPLRGHVQQPTHLMFSKNGTTLVSFDGPFSRQTCIWDVATSHLLEDLSNFWGDDSSDDDSILAVAFDDCTMRAWDLESRGASTAIKYPGLPPKPRIDLEYRITMSGDGSTIALAFEDWPMIVYDVKTGVGKCLENCRPARGSLIAISYDGSRLALATLNREDRQLQLGIWDVHKEEPREVPTVPSSNLQALAFSLDGGAVSISYTPPFDDLENCFATRVLDANSGHCLSEWQHQHDLGRMTFSADGSKLATVGYEPSISAGIIVKKRLWNVKTGACFYTWHFRNESLKELILEYERDSAVRAKPTLEVAEEGDWLTLGTERAIWLPPDYRPSFGCVRTLEGLLIVSASGRTTSIQQE